MRSTLQYDWRRIAMSLLVVLVSSIAAAYEPNRQPNLLVNGSFDSGSGDTPSSWGREQAIGVSTQEWTSALAVSGGYSVKTTVNVKGQSDWRQYVSGIDPSIRYRFRAHVHATNVAAGSHSIELQWFDASWHYLGRTTASSTVANTWVEVSRHDIVPPAGATGVYILLRTYQPGTYHFDDVTLTRQDENLFAPGGMFPTSVYQLTSTNLLSNSDMEQRRDSLSTDSGNGGQIVCSAPGRCLLPAFWNTEVDIGSATQTWERLAPKQHALKTVMTVNGQADWRQLIPGINPASKYKLSAWIQADNVTLDSHSAEVQWFDANWRYLGRNRISATTAGTWNKLVLPGLTPPTGTTQAWVLLRTYKTGTYLFDNALLEVDLTNAERLQEVKNAGFTMAAANGRASLDEVGAAGLKAVYKGVPLFQETAADATQITNSVNAVESHPALSIWMGRDEPAWERYSCPTTSAQQNGMCPEFAANAYQTVRQVDDAWSSAPHRVWINHAPRGTVQEPLNFDRLRPFNAAADIISMDVYPVPNDNGHVRLPSGKTDLSSMGEYVDILYTQVAQERSRQVKPIWMMPQGFAWHDLIRDTPYDGGDTRRSYFGASIEVHWFDAYGSLVTAIGQDGVAHKVVDILQTNRPNEWRYVFEQQLQPPPEARTAIILLRTYDSGIYWFDDVEFVEEGGADLIVNGSFENGTNGTPTGWSRSTDAGSCIQTWDSSNARTGSKSVKTELHSSGQHDWRQYIPVNPSKRYRLGGAIYAQIRPTWEQTRFMAYNALIHGARGLSWWGNHYIPINTQLWQDLKRIAGELNELSPALVSPAPFRSVTANWWYQYYPTLETLLLQRGSDLYLIVANPSPNSSAGSSYIHVDGLPLTSAERLFESGTVNLSNNGFSDNFKPYQVHVYHLR